MTRTDMLDAGLPLDAFPAQCPWAPAPRLDLAFLPEPGRGGSSLKRPKRATRRDDLQA